MEAGQNPFRHGENLSLGENFTDEATKMKIRKHLNDINDTITEDDIRNVKLFVPVSSHTGRELSHDGGNGKSLHI